LVPNVKCAERDKKRVTDVVLVGMFGVLPYSPPSVLERSEETLDFFFERCVEQMSLLRYLPSYTFATPSLHLHHVFVVGVERIAQHTHVSRPCLAG